LDKYFPYKHLLDFYLKIKFINSGLKTMKKESTMFLQLSGTVASPNYPSIYAGGLNKGWLISSSDSTQKIQLTIDVLDIECSCPNSPDICEASSDVDCADCLFDYLVSNRLN
jgi:hypothetical protein